MPNTMEVWVSCPPCDGTGKMKTSALDAEGNPTPEIIEVTCPACGGVGKVVKEAIDSSDIMNNLEDIKQKLDETKEVCDDIWDKVNV